MNEFMKAGCRHHQPALEERKLRVEGLEDHLHPEVGKRMEHKKKRCPTGQAGPAVWRGWAFHGRTISQLYNVPLAGLSRSQRTAHGPVSFPLLGRLLI